MKWNFKLRLAAIPLMSILLLASVPVVQAASIQESSNSVRDQGKRKKKQVPEGSATVILMLAASAMGGGLLVWRRKKQKSLA